LLRNKLLAVLGIAIAPMVFADQCPPPGYTRAQLLEIRHSGFSIESDQQRNALAVALAGCTGEPDPAVRDGVAYEGIATWLHGRSLSQDTVDVLYRTLSAQLEGEADPLGFRRPFAALLLSEVARADRIEAAFKQDRRKEMVALATSYLEGVRDYRGYSETEGWRHGVAHGSDLVLQLVLNPQIEAVQIKQLLDAVATQVAPEGAVFYHYGEPERMARAVFYAHRRGVLEDSVWQEWFGAVSSAQPLENWGASFSSQAGLAKRHNTLGFLMALHLNASMADDDQGRELDKWVIQAITRVLGS